MVVKLDKAARRAAQVRITTEPMLSGLEALTYAYRFSRMISTIEQYADFCGYLNNNNLSSC